MGTGGRCLLAAALAALAAACVSTRLTSVWEDPAFKDATFDKVLVVFQNTDPALTLRSATLSAVVFDQAGNILGGGNGFAFAALPPGAREFLSLGNGFDVIPMEKAAQARVSITPSWQQASG